MKRNESEATARDAAEKALKAGQAKMLARLAAKKEMERRMAAKMGKKDKKEKVDPFKAARMLGGGKATVLLKLCWGAWRIGVSIGKAEKAQDKRERWWRRTCVFDHKCVGNCGACDQLKDTAYQLPFGADFENDSKVRSFKQAGNSLLAATRMGLRTADSNPYLLEGFEKGLDGTSSSHRATTAPNSTTGMNLSSSLPSLTTGSPANAKYSGADRRRTSATREQLSGTWDSIPPGGKWEEATRWGSGQRCWYNKYLGRISYVDPAHHNDQKVAQLGENTGHSRHYTEAAHVAAEQRAEYLAARDSSHFRDLDDFTHSRQTVTELDLGYSRVGRY